MTPQFAVNRIRFRRALTLLLMTLVLPGSAQIAVGKRKIGRAALRIWFGLWLVGLVIFLLTLLNRQIAYWLVANTFFLGTLRVVLIGLALGWAYLFVDAWRLGEPLGLQQRQRLVMFGVNGLLCFSVAGGLLFGAHLISVQRDFILAMFSADTVSPPHEGRYNVLLLGGDSGATRWGLRPDSITLASIDAETGKTVLIGLPRNLQNFPFRAGSEMAKAFPNGYNCKDCELNSLVTWIKDHPKTIKSHHPGIEATIQGVEGVTGLRVNYFVMVNLQGFRNLVDAVGGVKLRVIDPIPKGAIGDFNGEYIPAGTQVLNGDDTLWFARSRMAADDYSRMARQKCVMSAMLQQLSPAKAVSKIGAIATASKQMVKTNLPKSDLDTFIDLALKAKSQPLGTLSIVPPLVDTSNPDIAKVQAAVQAAIAKSKAPKPVRKAPKKVVKGGSTGGSIGDIKKGYKANQTGDLGAAC